MLMKHSKDTISAKLTTQEQEIQEPGRQELEYVGFDPAHYERWEPRASEPRASILEASRVRNESGSIPLFVRRSPSEISKAEAALFLGRLTQVYLELARISEEKDAGQLDPTLDTMTMTDEKVGFFP